MKVTNIGILVYNLLYVQIWYMIGMGPKESCAKSHTKCFCCGYKTVVRFLPTQFPKECKKDSTTYEVKLSNGSHKKHPLYLPKCGELYIQWMMAYTMLLKKMTIKSKYHYVSKDCVLAVTGECNASKSLGGVGMESEKEVHEFYSDALESCCKTQMILNSTGLSVFQLLNCILDLLQYMHGSKL